MEAGVFCNAVRFDLGRDDDAHFHQVAVFMGQSIVAEGWFFFRLFDLFGRRRRRPGADPPSKTYT